MFRPLFVATRGAVCAAALLFSAAPAGADLPHFGGVIFPGADGLPKITKVQIAGGPSGYSAIISGVNFGAAPSDVPCAACLPPEAQVYDLASVQSAQAINVNSWSNTQITLSGIPANPGDPLQIYVYNDAVGTAAAWGGLVSEIKGVPKIKSVVLGGSGISLTVTITGSGFGSAPYVVGQNTNSPYFVFSDLDGAASGYGTSRWNAGFCGEYECDGVTMGYASWTNTQIVMSGFGSEYGSNFWYSSPSDAFCVVVWPSTSTSNGTTGGNTKCGRLPK